ncbi:hypothetical protein DQ384_19195 [Sphaerisporangium album]|uniref:Uncharacterized protein n=1 Tax=Sphaerisporangium album TaxID=509200 RepID=A0A367FH72_9ACTN|nr:hypothetical protein [Sphaerisporangium album]RCG29706.1 hypothetical protein DQ384_19195 [Sphaerisporangium album]
MGPFRRPRAWLWAACAAVVICVALAIYAGLTEMWSLLFPCCVLAAIIAGFAVAEGERCLRRD